MSRAVRFVDLSAVFLLLTFTFTALAFVLFPPSYWIEVRSVVIEDGIVGEPVALRVDRDIHHAFKGRYDVYIRTLPGQTAFCEATGRIRYRPDATLPDPVTLEWWAYSDVRCHGANLPAGQYSMKTCWTIELPLWFSRETCTASPAFAIKPNTNGAVPDERR